MSFELPVPVKPGNFNCPNGYEAMDCNEKFLSSDEEEDDFDLVLIRAPYDLEFSLLNETSFPINGSKMVELKCDKASYPIKMNSQPIFPENTQLGNLSLMINQDTNLVPARKKFLHHLEITKYVSVPEVTFPETVPNDFSIPKDLKQRYKPFGSDDPVVEIDEKAVNKHKKKSKKKVEKAQLETSVKVKRSTELEEKMKFTAQYVNQLDGTRLSDGTKKPRKKKEKSKFNIGLEKLVTPSSSEREEVVEIIEKKKRTTKSNSNAKKMEKKRYQEENKKTSSESSDEAENQSRQEMIDMIMGRTPQKSNKKLQKPNINYTFSQEF